jgi:hypothetical protein
MAQYMLLIYVPAEGGPTPEAQAEMAPEWGSFTQSLQDAGVMVAGDALQGTDTATTIRVRDGETLVSDGPFAETKEILGGYYLIEVPDLDEALKWAAKVPNVGYGSLEVRPVMVFDTPETADTAGASAQA